MTAKRPSRQDVVTTAEALFRDQFERVAEMPLTWRLTAESLLRAARALIPMMEADHRAMQDPAQREFEHPVDEVYMLLAGFAIENLAKAMLVERDPASVTSGGKLNPAFKNHRLVDLVHATGVTLTEDESYLAERLESFVVWAGRYPTPGKVEEGLPRTHPGGGWGPLNHIVSTDFDSIEAVAAKLNPSP